MEILEFVFSTFWRWLGSVVLLVIIADIPKGIIHFAIKKVIQKKIKEREIK